MTKPRLTAQEIADMVNRLDKRLLPRKNKRVKWTARRVRYALNAGRMEQSRRGHTQLYGPEDVALIRLALRLELRGCSAWVARVVIAYLREALTDAFSRSQMGALHVQGMRAALRPIGADAAAGTIVQPLSEAWSGVVTAMKELRRQQPTVWMWRELDASDAQAQAMV
jgi:hypothetical protein